jgi:hypothetical protein
LSAQILGNLPGAPSIDKLSPSTQGAKINAALDNPIAQIFLKTDLINQLVKELGVSQEQAGSFVSNALNPILLKTNFNSVEDFAAAVAQGLKDQGLSGSLSLSLAGTAAANLNSEIAIPTLDRTLTNANFDNAAAAIQSNSRISVSDRNTLQAAFDKVTSQNPSTAREFLTSFRTELTVQGLDQTQASQQAILITRALHPAVASTAATSPLLQSGSSTLLKPPDLAETLTADVVDKFTPALGELRARLLADKVNNQLISSNSISSDFKQELKKLTDAGKSKEVSEFYANANVTKPSVPLYALKNAISQIIQDENITYMDPAKQSDVMNYGALKSLKKPPLDINV